MTKAELLEYVNSLPDDDAEQTNSDVKEVEKTSEPGKEVPNTNNTAEEKEITSNNKVDAEFVEETGGSDSSLPASGQNQEVVETRDVTVMSSEDAIEDSIEMRIAAFESKYQTLEKRYNEIEVEFAKIANSFRVLNNSVDGVSPMIDRSIDPLEVLVNRL